MEELKSSIEKLYEKYKNDEYVIQKMEGYIKTTLPSLLETYKENYHNRKTNNKKIREKNDIFINKYINMNAKDLFYCLNSEFYFEYKNNHYNIINEDDIQHDILTTISKNKNLMQWKYKIKNNIMKKIKNNLYYKSIPESKTIQNVLSYLYPNYFTSKIYAKYFLTILGDNIMKKKNNEGLIILTNSRIKYLLNEINCSAINFLGVQNIINNFKFKYYDHVYENCRILNINIGVDNKLLMSENAIMKYMLDLLIVACHYSNRYKNSDEYLKKELETDEYNDEIRQINYMKYKNKDDIVNDFIKNVIINRTDAFIDNDNMIYLWKKYIKSIKIPNILFNETLKDTLNKYLKYDDSKKVYTNVTSRGLPKISTFLSFWNKTINETEHYVEYEISEIKKLFIMWLKQNSLSVFKISEELILNILNHFKNELIIEDNKFVLNIKCSLWNKELEIQETIVNFKKMILEMQYESNELMDTQTIHNIYNYYIEKSKYVKDKIIISKRYFEKYTELFLEGFIGKDGFIKSIWYEQ